MISHTLQAVEVLRNGGTLVELAEAIGIVISDPASSLDEIRLGLRHGGFVEEQASLALAKRQGTIAPVEYNSSPTTAKP